MRLRVLLIDDEPGALEGMQLWIDWEGLGYEVCGMCGNGAEGLQMIEQLQPDVVLTDINMPVMNGLEMIKRWQEQGERPVRFVILSGYSEFEYARKALRYNVTHYLLKPMDEEEAERELRSIYMELRQEAEQRRIRDAALWEQTLRVLQEAVVRPPVGMAEQQLLERLSSSRQEWQVCLVQTERSDYDWARELATERLSSQDGIYVLHMNAGQFVIVRGGSHASEQPGTDWHIINELAHEYADRPIQIARGGAVPSLSQLHHSYAEAREALRDTFYCPGAAGAIAYRRDGGAPILNQYDQTELINKLLSALMLLDTSAFHAAVEEAASLFRSQRVAPEIVKKVVIHLWYEMDDYVREHGPKEAELLLQEPEMPGAVESLLRLETCMERLLAWGEACIGLLLKEQKGKLQGTAQDINDYIKEHYREALTIKRLSEVFYLHPAYLGQLLIKKNGISFNELLHNLRIEEAEELLRIGKYTNSEVSELVGYTSYSQFLKQFEKRFHMSPNEYKNRN